MPISTWDGYTIFVILSTIVVSTFFMAIATRRAYRLQVNAVTNECEFKFNFFEKVFLLLSFATVVVVVGLQMSNSDYETYKYLYNYTYSSEYNLFQLEGVFRAINKFVYDYLHEFQYVVLITSGITNIFMFNNVVYYSLRSKIKPKYALFIYLSMYLLVSFGMMRQICSASIVIFSLRYVQKRQYFRYAFFTLLALGFHATAVMSLPLFLFIAANVRSKDAKLLYRVVTVIVFYVAVIFSHQILSMVGQLLGRTSYSDYYAVESIGLGNLIYRMPVLVFLFLFRAVIKKSPSYVKMFSVLVLFETIVCFTYYFMPMLGGRLQYYILFGYTVVIPYCLNTIKNEKKIPPIVSSLIIYGYGLYYLFNQLSTTKWITEFLMPIVFFEF